LRRLGQRWNLAGLVLVRDRGGLAEQVDHDDAVLNLLDAPSDNLAYRKSVALVARRASEAMREGCVRDLFLTMALPLPVKATFTAGARRLHVT
jgi:hypothetical protein